MKAKQLICSLSTLLIISAQMIFVAEATAVPIQYQVSGTIQGEWIASSNGMSIVTSYDPAAPNTPFSATFFMILPRLHQAHHSFTQRGL